MKRKIIWPNLGLIEVGTRPHAPSEAERVSPSLVRFGWHVWARAKSSDDHLPPIDPSLCLELEIRAC